MAQKALVLPPESRPCPRYRAPTLLARLAEASLPEISGLGASLRQDDLFWVHNDSGDEARVYAVSQAGTWLATFRLPGHIKAEDIEDIAVAVVDGRKRIYLADTGDNLRVRRGGVWLHRFDEPALDLAPGSEAAPSASIERRVGPIESAHLHYPDGAHDVEAFLVDPWSGEFVLLTKSLTGWARIYVGAQFEPNVMLRFAGEMTPSRTLEPVQLVTGGDVTRDGHYIGVRTYAAAYLFERRRGESLSDALLRPTCLIQVAEEKQGEALALVDQLGTAPRLLTVSEGNPTALMLSEPEGSAPKAAVAPPAEHSRP